MSDTLGILNYSITSVIGQPLPGVQVAVLTGDLTTVVTTSQPGTPLATLHSDPGGVHSTPNPTTPDGDGNVSVCPPASGNYYVLQIYGPGVVGQQLVQVFVPHP